MPAVLVIGGKGKPDKGEPMEAAGDEGDDEEPSSSRAEARTEASRAVIRAVKMNDPSALDKALSAHYKACEGAEEEEEPA